MSEKETENVTEFVMRKNGNYVEISAVVNGTQVFWASPPVTSVGPAIKAAVKTWLTRAWENELTDLLAEDDESKSGLFR